MNDLDRQDPRYCKRRSAGIDLVTIAAMLEHSRIQMLLRYSHPSEEYQFNAMRKIETHRAAKA